MISHDLFFTVFYDLQQFCTFSADLGHFSKIYTKIFKNYHDVGLQDAVAGPLICVKQLHAVPIYRISENLRFGWEQLESSEALLYSLPLYGGHLGTWSSLKRLDDHYHMRCCAGQNSIPTPTSPKPHPGLEDITQTERFQSSLITVIISYNSPVRLTAPPYTPPRLALYARRCKIISQPSGEAIVGAYIYL